MGGPCDRWRRALRSEKPQRRLRWKTTLESEALLGRVALADPYDQASADRLHLVLLEQIQTIRPILHHAPARRYLTGVVVGGADAMRVGMRQLGVDPVQGIPVASNLSLAKRQSSTVASGLATDITQD
ncbi:hypothetical protein [Gluconacetobacter sacchari]|uniref:Uncharacterized protein n=2 Tax=Gluconacetobacter sacchari TaxID=92759 RepID=A0A7W4NSU1_9PROT|nr:hypothetical protein [Gluconacetobacter sacchari]MBB2162433.1 hypothetical protein [Gluconacetobacter sacchari]